MTIRAVFTCAMLGLIGVVPACSDEHHDEELPPECEVIREACHEADNTNVPGLPNTCHELAHDGNAAKCVEQQQACIDACEGDGGTHDGGTHDGG